MNRPHFLAICFILGAVMPGVADGVQGDAAAGKRKATPCNGCHAVSSFKAMPRLGGQTAAYIFQALTAYETHMRAHRTMQDVARGLSARDMRDLAAFYASLPRGTASAENEVAPAPALTQRCAVCHADRGSQPATADAPLLVGQSAGYLEQTLKEYRSGDRVHAIMREQARDLSDQDIVDLVNWYSGQPGLVLK
jgi:cytochrome c553